MTSDGSADPPFHRGCACQQPVPPQEEKTVSYMRKEFRSTAEARKRPPLLAEAMVNADVDIPG
jgi:membrane-bound ClpP family serine protease